MMVVVFLSGDGLLYGGVIRISHCGMLYFYKRFCPRLSISSSMFTPLTRSLLLRGLGTEHLSMDGNHVLSFKLEDNQHVYVDWDKL